MTIYFLVGIISLRKVVTSDVQTSDDSAAPSCLVKISDKHSPGSLPRPSVSESMGIFVKN